VGSEDIDENKPVDEDLGFPVADDEPAALETDEEPAEERELTAMEMMGAPNRASESARKTVLWISLSFASVLFMLTLAVVGLYGLDILTLFSAVLFGFMCFVLIGAVRYKGEDPMAQFDPPPRTKTRFFRRKKK
jgi:Flp pilus assembly protein TadB